MYIGIPTQVPTSHCAFGTVVQTRLRSRDGDISAAPLPRDCTGASSCAGQPHPWVVQGWFGCILAPFDMASPDRMPAAGWCSDW
jgi:hypothetical protein